MDLDVIFLGTAASAPTASRSTAAALVRRGAERILIDCGEGTQRQLMASEAGLSDLDVILLTHTHADHVLGLPGLLKTFALRERTTPLSLYGPPGTRALLRALQPIIGRLPYPFATVEVEPGGEVGGDGYTLHAPATVHRSPSVGWALVEDDRPGRFDVEEARRRGVPPGPLYGRLQRGETVVLDDGSQVEPEGIVGESRTGRRLVFSGDTRPCDAILAAALDADVLVHEATFLDEDLERARETGHSTAREAAELARDADVRLLALTHLSTRYAVREVKAAARAVFPETVVPRDFDRLDVPFPERGEPRMVRAGGAGADAPGQREPLPEVTP
jgi:ribonuclease Z